jgi:hypothetical protein
VFTRSARSSRFSKAVGSPYSSASRIAFIVRLEFEEPADYAREGE